MMANNHKVVAAGHIQSNFANMYLHNKNSMMWKLQLFLYTAGWQEVTPAVRSVTLNLANFSEVAK